MLVQKSKEVKDTLCIFNVTNYNLNVNLWKAC
jgi:hypothetical protein